MNKAVERSVGKAVDSIQRRLADYACGLNYDDLAPEVIHGAKIRIIDTLGVLIGGFFAEPCRIARRLAAALPDAGGATVIGTRIKTMPDIAAFVNATAVRYTGMADSYHWPGSPHGHPSDALTPVLAVAEYAQTSGRAFITGVVLAYEVYLRICDVFHHEGFYNTNLACLGTAVAAGKLLGLSSSQLAHCISMAIVPNIVLKQVISGHKTMFRAAASGQAGRAGVFAALLAQAGMEGPHLPFEGKAGWCDHVAGERFSLGIMGGTESRFKILDTQIKTRAADGDLTACVLAAERLAPLNVADIKRVIVEVYRYAKERTGTDELAWSPDSRESADHSAPYVVATALIEGTTSVHSYNANQLRDPARRALMQKIEVVENPEFTQAFERLPVEHHARITVITHAGGRLVGAAGGGHDDLAAPKSDAQIEEKFRGLTADVLSAKQVDAILDRLWDLEELANVAEIPPAFVFD